MKAPARAVAAWRTAPESTQRLIVRVSCELDEATQAMSQRGIKVRRKLRLIDSLAIVCTGRQALTLLEIPWVIGIHPDAPVQVSGEGGPGKTE